MKMLPKKSGLLFAAVLALAAFVLPASASAVGWENDSASVTHSLTSTDLQFHAPAGALGWSCTSSRFHTDFVSTTNLKITAAVFTGCTGQDANGAGCTVTTGGTGFPWTATGTSTAGGVIIHNVRLDLVWDGPCAIGNGFAITLTGSLNGGDWNNATHVGTFASDTGLVGHSVLGTLGVNMTGTIRDDQQGITIR